MNNSKIIFEETTVAILKSTFGAIPYIGTAINEILFDAGSRIRQKSLNEFIIQLSDQIATTDLSKVNPDFYQSDEFYDLTRGILENVIKVKSQEKLKALAKVYMNSVHGLFEEDKDLEILFMNFVIELLPIQIQILHFIEKFETELEEIGSYENFYNSFVEYSKMLNLDRYKLKFSLESLSTKALVSFGSGLSDFDSTSIVIVTEDSKPQSVKLTTVGEKFIELLK